MWKSVSCIRGRIITLQWLLFFSCLPSCVGSQYQKGLLRPPHLPYISVKKEDLQSRPESTATLKSCSHIMPFNCLIFTEWLLLHVHRAYQCHFMVHRSFIVHWEGKPLIKKMNSACFSAPITIKTCLKYAMHILNGHWQSTFKHIDVLNVYLD